MGVYVYECVRVRELYTCVRPRAAIIVEKPKAVWQHCARRSVVYKIKVAREWVAIEKNQESDRVRQRESADDFRKHKCEYVCVCVCANH